MSNDRRLIPASVTTTPAVAEANEAAAAALVAARAANDALRAAKAEAEAAPADDAERTRAAVAAGKPTPKPTVEAKQAAVEAARRRATAATELADEALAVLANTISADRGELARSQTKLIEKRTAALEQLLDQVAEGLDLLADPVGVSEALYHYPNRRGFTPANTSKVKHLLGSLRAEAAAMCENATPMRERVLDLVGEKPTTWDSIARALGKSKIDSDLGRIRGYLLSDGLIEWCDRRGAPVPASGAGGIAIRKRYLKRGTGRLTKVEEARAARREREAAAA